MKYISLTLLSINYRHTNLQMNVLQLVNNKYFIRMFGFRMSNNINDILVIVILTVLLHYNIIVKGSLCLHHLYLTIYHVKTIVF